MCLSMSTAAQRQLVAPHGAAESLAGLWILKGSVTAAQVDDGAKIDISQTHTVAMRSSTRRGERRLELSEQQ
tara:strand:+ start:392 stop:607 length:216 start_codon:yes stop_codon:yes gene_type:complete